MTTKLGVIGAGGRMGREIINAIAKEPEARLAGAVEHADHACVGARLAGGLIICSNPLALAHASDVLIDFTSPDALAGNLDAAQAARHAIVIGTTGLTPRHHAAIDAAARRIPVLQAANMSLGGALLTAMVEQAAARLGEGWDVELLELHHGAKLDAPSGTALMLGEAVARGRGERRQSGVPRTVRTGSRQPGEVGFAVLRGGSSAGEHTVHFLGDGERVELTHRAENRAVFARGAVLAAMWLAGRPAGRYTMHDVLGIAAERSIEFKTSSAVV